MINEIFLNGLLFILAIGLYIILPGYIILTSFGRKGDILDSFFIGISLYFTSTILISIFTNSHTTYRLVYPLVLFIIIVIISGVTKWHWVMELRRCKDYLRSFHTSFSRDRFTYLSILGILVIIMIPYRITHNFHYDDTLHLAYLSDYLRSGEIFPHINSYYKVLLEWGDRSFRINDYSFFVVLYTFPTLFFNVDFTIAYYLWGGILFIVLLLLFDRFVDQFISHSVVIKIIFILSFLFWHHNNPLNFGGYPLDVAKIIFYSGIYYLLKYLDGADIINLLLSIVLLNLSWAIHLNLLITFLFLLPLVSLIFYIGYREKRKLILRYSLGLMSYSSGLVLLLILGTEFIY
ncbi:MAG: hypothetical protein AAB257_02660 [Nitrospinota bacterium]